MKKTRFCAVLVSIFALVTMNINIVNASESRRLPIVSCDGSFNEYVSRTTGHEELIWNSGIHLAPGDSMSIKWNKSYSVSNEVSINILPELLDMGYSTSYSVEVGMEVTVHNNSNVNKPVNGYRIYDNVKYMKGEYIGDGACTYTTPKMKVYKGFMLACK